MTYEEIVAAHHDVLRTMAVPEKPKSYLDYEPPTIQHAPIVYSLFDRQYYQDVGQLRRCVTRVLHRIIFHWQERPQAEKQLVPYVDEIKRVFADGQLKQGRDWTEHIETIGGWIKIGGAMYRALEVIVETKILDC